MLRMLSRLWLATRTLLRDPYFTFIYLISIGIGVASSVLVFACAFTMIFRPLRVSHPEALVNISVEDTGGRLLKWSGFAYNELQMNPPPALQGLLAWGERSAT